MPKRPTLKVTDEFYEAVAAYKAQHGLKSWAQAILELAAIGYQHQTGKPAPKAFDAWGGKREKAE